MAEIRLTCPGCGAEYKLPADAIPAEGREVECSACSRVWLAASPGAPASPVQPRADNATEDDESQESGVVRHLSGQPAASLRRRLPADVLSILRDEVEHERRARAADTAPFPAPPDEPAEDPDWPATTVTTVTRHGADAARPPVPTAQPSRAGLDTAAESTRPPPPGIPAASLAPDDVIPFETPPPGKGSAGNIPQPPPAEIAAPAPADITLSGVPDATHAPTRPVQDARTASYRMGFGLSAMIAATALTLYLLAPSMQGTGAVGDGLMNFREQIDQGRVWLSESVAALVTLG